MITIPAFLIFVVIGTSSLLAISTAVLYLRVMEEQFGFKITHSASIQSWWWAAWVLLVFAVGFIIIRKTVSFLTVAKRARSANTSKPLKLKPHYRWLAIAAFTTVFLAGMGPIFASFVGEPGLLIDEVTGFPKLFTVWVAFVFAVAPVVLVMVPIALAVPNAELPQIDE